MPVAFAPTPPPLIALLEHPDRVRELSSTESAALLVKVAGLLAALGARLGDAIRPAPGLQPPLTVEETAPLVGMQPDTLRRRTKSDPAYRALVFDNGTDRLLFDAEKVAAFRRRRTG